MRITTGDVHLTVVQGGLCAPEPSLPGDPIPASLLASFAEDYELQEWEARLFLDRLEAFLGRRVDEDEAALMLQRVWAVRHEAQQMVRMLAGLCVVVPIDRGGAHARLVETEGPSAAGAEWAERAKREFSALVRRTA